MKLSEFLLPFSSFEVFDEDPNASSFTSLFIRCSRDLYNFFHLFSLDDLLLTRNWNIQVKNVTILSVLDFAFGFSFLHVATRVYIEMCIEICQIPSR